MRRSVFVFSPVVLTLVLFAAVLQGAERSATAPTALRVMLGFQVELLRSAQPGEGSWISMTFDGQGRVILGEDRAGLLRLTLGGTPETTSLEVLPGLDHLQHCRGVLWTPQGLFATATNGEGFYRLRDLKGDGTYEAPELIIPLDYRSRYGHGANQIRLGPDGMLYIAIGNDVAVPAELDPHSPYRGWQNDWLLPNPHDAGQDERVGYILKTDFDGKTRTMLVGGLRNQVDVAFNSDGEMFTWDADMEWDVGLPWYRPTRINHLVSGGEYGWRYGTGKWPAWYPDSLPATIETGLGSPTALTFGNGSNWPSRYRDALFGADWQHGRILMFDMLPHGATYSARSSVLVEGSPLNVCDMTFGPDGELYFITGGRGSQSGLYRVTYRGDGEPEKLDPISESQLAAAADARKIRHQLEELHVREDAAQLDFIWSQLGSDDVYLRFAARVALENLPDELWARRVASEPDSPARHTALLALARVGGISGRKVVMKGLREWDWNTTEPRELLWGLRTLQLAIIRQGMLDDSTRPAMLRKLHSLPTQESFAANWLLLELLVALKSPEVIDRGLILLEGAETQEEQVQYVKTLVRVDQGWTSSQRERMLTWFYDHRQLPGGKLMKTVLLDLRTDFLATFSAEEQTQLASLMTRLDEPIPEEQVALLPARPFVKAWTVAELEQDVLSLRPQDRSVEKGRAALAAGVCLRCHQLGDRGGHVGPDLSNVGKRFDGRALLESILEPSRVIDPKYHNSVYQLEDGRVVSGRTMSVNKEQIGVEINPLTGQSVVIARGEIVDSKSSEVSPMPEGLLNTFTRDEILDLIAYLRSAGG